MDSGGVVIVVDDDPAVRRSLSRLLRSAGYVAQAFASAQELLDAGELHAACLVLDVHLGGPSGFELDERLRARGEAPPAVFISAQDDETTRGRANRARPGSFLRKPFEASDLLDALESAIGESGSRTEHH